MPTLSHPFSHVLAHVAQHCNLLPEVLLSKDKTREVARARSYCFHILRYQYGRSIREVAKAFNVCESAVRASCDDLPTACRQFPAHQKDLNLLTAFFTLNV